jgi:branched-chain amino acid transport system permease protein
MEFYLVQVLTGLSSAAVLFLIASGLTLVFGVSRILNFAHGSFYMLGAYIAYTLTQVLGDGFLGFWGSLLLASVLTGLIGAVLEMVILRRIYHVPELFQILATFGLILIVQDITLHAWGPEDLLGPQAPGLKGAVTILGEPFPTYDIVLIAMAIGVWVGLWLLLHKTRFGTLVRAATQDRGMVACLGINQKWLFTSVFFLGCILAGFGGAIQLPRESVSLSMDMNIIIEAVVVVVIGGMGSIRGAAVASIIVGLVQAFGILIFPQITLVVVFLIMAIVLIFKPYGLFGKPEDVTVEKSLLSDQVLRPAGHRICMLYGAFIVLLLALPWLVGNYGLVLATDMMIFALFAASLHFIMSPGGIGSFGHALYFGLGAYAVALLIQYYGVSMGWALVAAPLAAGLGGLVFGWMCVRSSGIYLAMLTFAFAQITWAVAFQWYDVTGGDNGILGVWPSDLFNSKTYFYYLTLTLSGLSILFLRHVIFSPFGYTLRAIRDNPVRARAIGIESRRWQWAGLTFSGLFAGLAGGVFGYAKGSVFPTTLDMMTTLDALVITLLGGINTLAGPIVGSGVYIWLESEISRHTELWRAILGFIIITIVVFFPQGLVGFAQDKWRQMTTQKGH